MEQSDKTTSEDKGLAPQTCYVVNQWSKSPNGLDGRVKSPIIWGHCENENKIIPLAYVMKPKWMDKEDFMDVFDAIHVSMSKKSFKKSHNAIDDIPET